MGNSFNIKGLKITVPNKVLTENVARRMARDNYETSEYRALKKHLRPSDIYLDIGGGVGFTSCAAAEIVTPKNITVLEANPILIPAIKQNLSQNGFAGATVIHGAVSEETSEEKIILSHGDGFWAGHTITGRRKLKNQILVPVVSFLSLLRKTEPTFIGMDIEGMEFGLFKETLPNSVRFISMETHSGIYGHVGLKGLMQDIFNQGFGYVPDGSAGQQLCFEKLL